MMADLRIKRTKRAVHMAMEQLLLYKDYQDIRIKDLVEAALINRNTFYLHYQSLNDVLHELVANVIKRQTETITAAKFSQQPFILFQQLWSNLTPIEYKILQRQQNSPNFKILVIRMIMQDILVLYPDDSAVWFAFGKVTAIMAWLIGHDRDWKIDKDAERLQTMYNQEQLL